VSWKQHLRAAGRQTAEAARDLAGKAKDRADELAADNERAQASRRIAETAAARTTAAIGRARNTLDDGLGRAGRTQAGRRVGQTTRSTARTIRELPGLSAVVDTIMEKNGVDELRERVANDPADPMACIHLAAALQRAERDLRTYATARVLVNPGSLVLRQTFRAAAGLDARSDEPAQTRLLRRAFGLTKQRLAADQADAGALHALARIFLMQRQPHHAVKFAKKAAACDPEQAALPLVTLARAYLDLGQTRPARRAAEMATRQGMTLGYQILAATTGTPRPQGAASSVRAEAQLLARITSEDQRRYDGVAYTTSEISRAVVSRQREKTRTLSTTVAGGARQFQQTVADRFRAAPSQVTEPDRTTSERGESDGT
jgi:tetratricopeptide (TPR) repeat protein